MGNFAPSATGLLAPLQPWLEDSAVSEILMNKPGEVYVEKAGELARFEVPTFSERAVAMLFQLIANENNQALNHKKTVTLGKFSRRLSGTNCFAADG